MKIYEFEKNALEKVVFEITTYQGCGYLNMRVWFDASRGQNTDWKPSQKGITLSTDLIHELMKGLELAADFLSKEKKGGQE